MNFKNIIKTAFVSTLIFGVTSVFAEFKPVRIAHYTGVLCSAPVHVAWLKGYLDEEFKKIGQKYEMVPVNAEKNSINELIVANKVDAGNDLLATELQPIQNGLPITFVIGVHTGCTKFYVTKNSAIQNLNALKGRKTKVGVIGLSDSSVMSFRRKLRDLGIVADGPEADVEFIVYGASDLPIALEKGAVDVIALHDPTAATAEEQYGFKKLLDTSTDPKFAPEYCCVAFVSLKLWKENPEGAAAYTRAVARGSAFVAANPQEAARLQLSKDVVAGNQEFNAKLLESYGHIPSRKAARRTFKIVATELQQTGVLKAKLNIEKFINKHFADFEAKGIKIPDGYIYDAKTDKFTETFEEPKSLTKNI
ncbi:ABC transporter substrate-binding protein [Fibrobacter succinogenes]|uniref:ABC transporter substrate-binding protein n=1 Tax=Fibrobacter succinogenes TaxID=833 RepID=UPI00156548AB|nr:ABC transporter substrate-binding protein [Fibrobacter succinogenes]